MNKEDKGRVWACIIYPESVPDWEQRLNDLHIPAYVSPEHVEPGVKMHRHCLMCFPGQKSRTTIKVLTDKLGFVGQEYVYSKPSYMRYLLHDTDAAAADGKIKYSAAAIRCFGGIKDFAEALGEDGVSKYDSIDEMIQWCKDQDCWVFADLVDYARTERPDLFRVLVDKNSTLIMNYIKSRCWSQGLGRS